MKSSTDISNDLSKPLVETDIEWSLYLYKKRYKQKILDSYEMYKINTISLDTVYSDIHKHILENFINKQEICEYSTEMPKNKIGFIDLKNNSNILKDCLPLLNDGINSSVLFSTSNLSSHGYILECKISGQVYMQIFSTSNPIKVYKHRYSILFNGFDEITNPILTLGHLCDCVIVNNDYSLFFTNRAESVFDLEKHYKVLANKCLNSLKTQNLFVDFNAFSTYSSVWPKAAKFETFSFERMKDFAKYDSNRKIAILKRYNISSNEDGSIITNSLEENEQALKFVCGKLFTDFNNDSYEVAYPQKINLQNNQ